MNDTVSTLLSEKDATVFSVSPNASVLEAVHEMNRHRVGSILVLDDGKLVGIFTERDVLLRVIENNLSPLNTKIATVMTRDVETLSPEDSIQEAMTDMTEKRHRHLPVLDGENLVGIISIGDVTRWISHHNEQEASTLRSYITGCFL